jgi:hypothetical protein
MDSNEAQGTQMFEKTTTDPDSTWNTDTPLPHAELHEVIKRIYDEKLSEEMFAPKLRYDLLRFLMPDCPSQTIKNARKNHSSRKKDNIQYHLLKLVPQLFIAGLHYRNYERQGNESRDLMEPCKTNRPQRIMYETRLEQLVSRHFSHRGELEDEIEALETGKGYILESVHREEMKEIKIKHREELEEVTYQQGKKMEMKKEEMTDKINFLEGEIRKLMFEIKCLNQSNEYGSTSTDEMKDEEPEDIYKINE